MADQGDLLRAPVGLQISIPELGGSTPELHHGALTSNNTRELTEALKRRCLYLWLDYPDLEHELDVRAAALPRARRAARAQLVVIHQVRELDLKKPPSIAESIDWARALLLLGASDIDQQPRRDDQRDRQAPDRSARSRGPRWGEARPGDARYPAGGVGTAAWLLPSPRPIYRWHPHQGTGNSASAAHSPRICAGRAWRSASGDPRRVPGPGSRPVDRPERTSRKRWRRRSPSLLRTGGCSSSCSTGSSPAQSSEARAGS